MKLEQIARILGTEPERAGSIEITELAYDSRAVVPGSLFFCVPGGAYDGHDWAAQAVEGGASALVCERPLPLSIAQLIVNDSREAMSHLASAFFGDPSSELEVVGITGTNGKTTIAFMLESILNAAGEKAGLIGTVETRVAGEVLPAVRTTPEAIDLQRLLRRMVDSGVRRCAIEVTSIGLEKGRTEGLRFAAAVFTNLTHDHLDHHGTMERYYIAKSKLFLDHDLGTSVLNLDDPYGRRLSSEIPGNVLTYGIESRADLIAEDVQMGREGSSFRAVGPEFEARVTVRLPGAFNVSNSLAAIGAAHLLGLSPDDWVEGIAALSYVPGRFEPVDQGQDFLVLVDYAHTPDSLENVLRAARDLAESRVIAVFGCGGARDRAKRPVMGQVAARYADWVVVTSDNPRTEDPSAILSDIEAGIRKGPPPGGYSVVEDRAEAIERAVAGARKGDVVVIAGKGHERGQEFADRVIPFDDRLVAASALKGLR